jgi:hypothetical protein
MRLVFSFEFLVLSVEADTPCATLPLGGGRTGGGDFLRSRDGASGFSVVNKNRTSPPRRYPFPPCGGRPGWGGTTLLLTYLFINGIHIDKTGYVGGVVWKQQ